MLDLVKTKTCARDKFSSGSLSVPSGTAKDTARYRFQRHRFWLSQKRAGRAISEDAFNKEFDGQVDAAEESLVEATCVDCNGVGTHSPGCPALLADAPSPDGNEGADGPGPGQCNDILGKPGHYR